MRRGKNVKKVTGDPYSSHRANELLILAPVTVERTSDIGVVCTRLYSRNKPGVRRKELRRSPMCRSRIVWNASHSVRNLDTRRIALSHPSLCDISGSAQQSAIWCCSSPMVISNCVIICRIRMWSFVAEIHVGFACSHFIVRSTIHSSLTNW